MVKMAVCDQGIAMTSPSPVTIWVKGKFVFADAKEMERTIRRRVPIAVGDVPGLIAAFIEELRTIGGDFPEGHATLQRLLLWGTEARRGTGA